MNKLDGLSSRYEAAFCVFMAVLAFLGKDNPYIVYPQALYLFALLMGLNLAAGVALRLLPESPSVSAAFILANCATITAIQAHSGGAASSLWVLYLLPIFSVCLLLGPRETAWVTAGAVGCNAVFTLAETLSSRPVVVFEIVVKSGLFVATAVLAWKLAAQEREARSRLRSESLRAEGLTARLESASALKEVGLVSAGVAHDLRNVFMVILGFADTLLENGTVSPETRSALERIVRMAVLGGEMTHHLTRHGSSAQVKLADEDLAALASGMNSWMFSVFKEKKVRLEIQVPAEPCPVRASRMHVQRLFLNLLLNSLSVSAEGRKVRLEVRLDGKDAVAVVEDEGPGFAPEALAKAFVAFETTRADRGGTGLGLNLCSRIAREHGGTLAAENRKEGGARMTLRLPLREVPAAAT